jgi:uncharacterized membrane protein YedE/YeeE
MMRHGKSALLGLALGVSLSVIGFTDFDAVHQMFALQDLRLLFTFMGGVALLVVPLWFLKTTNGPPAVTPGTIPGSLLFGAGWALTGACPGVAFAQIGEGQVWALVSLGSMMAGTHLYPVVHRRFFRWPMGSCGV